MSEAETIVIVGQCSGITEKPSGWTEFMIAVPGNQYPVKLATKLDGLIQEARETRGGIATWTYKETEGDINPKSGKPYKNRYLEKVELGASAQSQSHGGTQTTNGQPEPHHEPVHFADKDRLITRQTCLKAAADLYTVGPAQYSEGDQVYPPRIVIRAAELFEEWLYRDIDGATRPTTTSVPSPSPASGKGLAMPQNWDDVRQLLNDYGDNGATWEMFERFGGAARKLMFGDEGLNATEKDQLWQVTVGAALALRDAVDAAEFPPPSEQDMVNAWKSVLDGQELQPVAKKEVPDAP